jgi:DNA mismatch repair protein MutS
MERILSKLSVGKGNARDMTGLKESLNRVHCLREELSETEIFQRETGELSDFTSLIQLIQSAIDDNPPLSLKEGGIIKTGFNAELDDFRKINRENREWINRYQKDQQESLSVSSLKVRYNKIIGYYIEVTKPNLHLVPGSYLKKQTLVNAERFTTEELEKHETQLMEARENSNNLELSLFDEIRVRVLACRDELYRASEIVAAIDVLSSLALVAQDNNYVPPVIVEDNVIDIQGGRHPVIEKLGEESFIENDLHLNEGDRRIMILTGPNMSGKSTFLRQSALIIIMAHMGSFVPARSATIGLVDRVFSRIGMADRLVKGESTFLVEMLETSRILHYATSRSFIIMDEIGRGTSTYDGLSIAWAVLEYLLESQLVGAKVVFATHYHEVTALSERHGVINYNATVSEWNNSVIFLRKIVPGSASKSYGIEVARMAGIPESIIERAKSILTGIETKYGTYTTLLVEEAATSQNESGGSYRPQNEDVPVDGGSAEKSGMSGPKGEAMQLPLFPSLYEVVVKELKNVDVNSITPLEALNILDRLKKSISL